MKAIFKAKTSMRHLQLLSILSSPFLVARAFTVVPRHSLVQHHHHRASSTTLASDFGSDFGSAMPNLVSPYERIGINEDDLALGVDPGEFLTYIGTKEDLIAKTMEDLPQFDRESATKEVEKFMLDQEAINFYIKFEKKKAEDPDFAASVAKGQEEGFFSFRTLLYVYVAYLIGNILILPQLRNYVAEQQAAGTWQGTNIPLIDDFLSGPAVQASAAVVTDTIQTVSDVVLSSSAGMS